MQISTGKRTTCGCDVVPCAGGSLEKSDYGTTFVANAVGSGNNVAKVIEFYIPDNFRKKAAWIPRDQRGEIIPFPAPEKKSA